MLGLIVNTRLLTQRWEFEIRSFELTHFRKYVLEKLVLAANIKYDEGLWFVSVIQRINHCQRLRKHSSLQMVLDVACKRM